MKKAKRAERFEKIAEHGCIICQSPCQIHHLVGLKYRGRGQKANDCFTIGLCHIHHTGDRGLHTIGIRTWETTYGTQESLLEKTNLLIGDD